uniref:hypothetical protein n=1 Tax=Glycomyces sp. NRRL B-16210 TaxID=1463821 RepID=UPI0005547366
MDTSTCTLAGTDATASASRSLHSAGAGRRAQAQAIRSALDTAADLINTQHAVVLRSVIDMQAANLHRTEFGFSALRDLLLSQFDFTFNTASAIA